MIFTAVDALLAAGLPWQMLLMAQWVIGAVITVWFLACAVRGFANFILIPRRGRGHLRQRYPSGWAVVTGASEGIGKSFAVELARNGFNVAVIARRMDKLDELVTFIESEAPPGVHAKAIGFDFGVSAIPSAAANQEDEELGTRRCPDYSRLFAELDALPGGIAILVNNVGMTLPWEGEHFEDYRPEALERIVRVNGLSMMQMCRYVIPGMKQRRCGAIVNLSSLTAIVRVVPFFAPYAATKAFVRSLSESLTAELEPFGVDVLTVSPGFVSTALTQGNRAARPPTSFSMVDPDEVARHTLGQLGRDGMSRVTLTAGHRNHQLTQWLIELLPKQWVGRCLYKAVLPEAQKLRKVK